MALIEMKKRYVVSCDSIKIRMTSKIVYERDRQRKRESENKKRRGKKQEREREKNRSHTNYEKH